jgi:hypothetical protein
VLHRHRAKLLAPLEGQLSATHYPGLSRSISLELGNVFREVADIKAAARRQPGKVRALQSCCGRPQGGGGSGRSTCSNNSSSSC